MICQNEIPWILNGISHFCLSLHRYPCMRSRRIVPLWSRTGVQSISLIAPSPSKCRARAKSGFSSVAMKISECSTSSFTNASTTDASASWWNYPKERPSQAERCTSPYFIMVASTLPGFVRGSIDFFHD